MPWVERPPLIPLIVRQGQLGSRLHGTRYVPATRERSGTLSRELDDPLVAGVAVAGAERVGELALEFARRRQLLDDVRAADELALDEDLRDHRPAQKNQKLLTKSQIKKNIDRGHGYTHATQHLEHTLQVTT